MRRVAVCLVTLFVCAACRSTVEPEITIQVQGTVTARDDGSPIVGATVTVSETSLTSARLLARVETNNQGGYSLSFIETGVCPERPQALLIISASAQGFDTLALGFVDAPDAPRVRCTEGLQTIDIQLERIPPP